MDDDADVTPVDDSATTIDDLRIAYSLNDCCVAEVRHLAEHYVEYVATPSADRAALAAGWDAHHLHHAAEHGNAAPAFTAFLRETSGDAREVVDGYADALATHGELAAFATYLRARAALAAGAATDAFADIERSVDADGDFLPALDLYATLLADGGRPVEALAVRKRITSLGAPPGDMNALQDILRQSSKIGRNDPCPCGSGRKYKQCCQRDPKVGPADRRRLALHQAVRHSIGPDGGYRDLYALGITAATAAAPTGRARAEIFGRVVADPFLVDLALHEGGRLDAYLAERGDLVSADEVAWLRALAATSLGLWAHERAADGSYRLTNLIADFTLDGVVFPPGAVPEADNDLLGRVVADGIDGRPSTIGPVMLVSPARRDDVVTLIERGADADAWAEWFGALVGSSR